MNQGFSINDKDFKKHGAKSSLWLKSFLDTLNASNISSLSTFKVKFLES